MACSINIENVVIVASVAPQRIRVYGRAEGCVQFQMTTSTLR
jgi:hypothetical protein